MSSRIAVPPNGSRVRIVNRSRNVTIADHAIVASRPWSRMRGLLGRDQLRDDEGLLILPCQGVHTFGMRYPIDVVHADRSGRVCRVLRGLRPWRVGPLVFRSYFVIELAAGTAAAEDGEQVGLETLPEPAALGLR